MVLQVLQVETSLGVFVLVSGEGINNISVCSETFSPVLLFDGEAELFSSFVTDIWTNCLSHRWTFSCLMAARHLNAGADVLMLLCVFSGSVCVCFGLQLHQIWTSVLSQLFIKWTGCCFLLLISHFKVYFLISGCTHTITVLQNMKSLRLSCVVIWCCIMNTFAPGPSVCVVFELRWIHTRDFCSGALCCSSHCHFHVHVCAA